jgi:hypothetical protein
MKSKVIEIFVDLSHNDGREMPVLVMCQFEGLVDNYGREYYIGKTVFSFSEVIDLKNFDNWKHEVY